MAVPSSGQLRLYNDIQVEVGGAQGNTSLHTMSTQAGFSTPDAMSDFYGYSSIELPSVTTCSAPYVRPNTLRIRGQVNNLGGAPAVAKGFRFGPYSNINSNSSITISNSSGTGVYCSDRSTNQTSTYYWHAWAQNAAGRATGNTCSRTTPACFDASNCSCSTTYSTNYMVHGGNSQTNSQHCITPSTKVQYSHPYLGWTTLGNKTACYSCFSDQTVYHTAQAIAGAPTYYTQSRSFFCNEWKGLGGGGPGGGNKPATSPNWNYQSGYCPPGFYLGCTNSGIYGTSLHNSGYMIWGCGGNSPGCNVQYCLNDYGQAYRYCGCGRGCLY